MKLCLITPYKELSCSDEGTMFFALTRELKYNKVYYNYFFQKKKEGFDVIVDNDIHENDPMSFEDHIQMALEVGTIIITPDFLRNKKKTLEYFHYFLDCFYSKLKEKKIKIMSVPQGDTIQEIDECFNEFNNDLRVDFIGNSFDLVPYDFCSNKYENQSINRMLIVNGWIRRTKKPIHLLGSNNLYELYLLNKFKEVMSTDGKIFSRLALANVKLSEVNWRQVDKTEIKMSFNDEFTTEQKELYKKNVEFFKKKMKE